MSHVKVRFAPSPTGVLHVGGIRTALFNYFFAKSANGTFVLRNEDTDQARKVEGSVEATMESLGWLSIEWDEVVTQSQRLDIYKKYAQELVSKGLALLDDGAVRFISKKDGITDWLDAIGNKKITFENKNIENFIILKKDGFPTYHLANVIDDHLMEITHVIRGEDWIPSTPKHIMLYEALGWTPPVFAHVPNVLGTDGKKLSKRRGAKSVLDFKNEGFLAPALLNYLMLLGWSPKNDREILTHDEIEREFSLEKVNVAPAIFDERKLLWMNGEYIRNTENKALLSLILAQEPSLNEMDAILVEKLIEPAKTRIKTLNEFKTMILPFLKPLNKKTALLAEYADSLCKIQAWNSKEITDKTVVFMKGKNIRYSEIYQDLVGEKFGLPLGEVFEILGKDTSLGLLK